MRIGAPLLLLCLSTSMFASPRTAADVLQKCQNASNTAEEIAKLSPSDQKDVLFCEGYVSAMVDMANAIAANDNSKKQGACAVTAPLKEVIKAVVLYLTNHPEVLHDPPTRPVITAIGRSVNCP